MSAVYNHRSLIFCILYLRSSTHLSEIPRAKLPGSMLLYYMILCRPCSQIIQWHLMIGIWWQSLTPHGTWSFHIISPWTISGCIELDHEQCRAGECDSSVPWCGSIAERSMQKAIADSTSCREPMMDGSETWFHSQNIHLHWHVHGGGTDATKRL